MAKIEDRKVKIKYLSGNPRNNNSIYYYYSLTIGKYRYVYNKKTNSLDRYDPAKACYMWSRSYHYTFRFSYKLITKIEAICKDKHIALLESRNDYDDYCDFKLFCKIKLKYFPDKEIICS